MLGCSLISFSVYCEIVTKLLLTGKYTWWIAGEAYWSCSYFSFRAQICHHPKTGIRSIMTDELFQFFYTESFVWNMQVYHFFSHWDVGSLFYNWVLLWNLIRKFFFPSARYCSNVVSFSFLRFYTWICCTLTMFTNEGRMDGVILNILYVWFYVILYRLRVKLLFS